MANHLYIAILLVCFYDALIVMLIPSSATFFLAEDGLAGAMVSTLLALTIGLWSLCSNGFKKLPNIWLAALLFFIVFSSFHSPNVIFDGAFIPKDIGLYNFKPMFLSLIYLLMFLGIYSSLISRESRINIGKAFSWTGIIYSAYIIFQHYGMDQLYKFVGTAIYHLSRNPQDGGFISQPVFAAALLTICLPFVYRYHSIFFSIIVIAAIVLTGNRSALIAVAISGLYLFVPHKKYVLYLIMAYIGILALATGLAWVYPHINLHICDSGRLSNWKMLLQNIAHPNFPGVNKSYILTGLGIGSFSVFFPFYNHSPFFQAHNEYLEVLYWGSLIGFFLFIKMQLDIFKTVQDHWVCASLIGISVFAITNPVWHIPQLQFLTVFLIGLAYNKEFLYVGKVT